MANTPWWKPLRVRGTRAEAETTGPTWFSGEVFLRPLPRAKDADPKELFDPRLLREIEASGFVKRLDGEGK